MSTKTLIVYMAHDRENGKCYFGSTFQTLEKRKRGHLNYAKRNGKSHFHRALLKRPDKFFWLVLESEQSGDRSLEQKYLDLYAGLDWCYNRSNRAVGFGTGKMNPNNGREWGPKHYRYGKSLDKQTRDKISKTLSGRKLTEEECKKRRGENSSRWGMKPWDNPVSSKNLNIWKSADIIHAYWSQHKCGPQRLMNQFRHLNRPITSYYRILNKFKEGWVPTKDPDWINFSCKSE